jgi:YD repeat-containing protein
LGKLYPLVTLPPASDCYDANGNLQTGGGRSYAWTADNQPTSITGSDGVREDYAYDADGTRVSRTRNNVTTLYLGGLVEQEGTTTRTHYGFHGQVLAQRDGSGVVTCMATTSAVSPSRLPLQARWSVSRSSRRGARCAVGGSGRRR